MEKLNVLFDRIYKDDQARKQAAVTIMHKIARCSQLGDERERQEVRWMIVKIMEEYRLKGKINQSPGDVIQYFHPNCADAVERIGKFTAESIFISSLRDSSQPSVAVAKLAAYMILAAALDIGVKYSAIPARAYEKVA